MPEPVEWSYHEPWPWWRVLAIAATAMAAAVLGAAYPGEPLPGRAALGLEAVLIVTYVTRRARRTWRVDDHGVTYQSGLRSETWGWEQILTVRRRRGRVVVGTRHGDEPIHCDHATADRLVEALQARLPRHEPSRRALPAADVEAWLNLPPGGTLRLERSGPLRLYGWLILIVLAAQLLLAVFTAWASWNVVWPVVAAFAAAGAWSVARPRITAVSGTGFQVARGLRAEWRPWSEVDAVVEGLTGTYIECAAGSCLLTGRADVSGFVAGAIRWILQAREQGELLPRLADVPDAALSRAGATLSADRGLSLGEPSPVTPPSRG